MSRQAIAAVLARDDLAAGERLVAFSLASFAGRDDRAWPGASIAAARAGLSRSRYLLVRDRLVARGLVVVESEASGRGRSSLLALPFVSAGPWWEAEINAELFEAVQVDCTLSRPDLQSQTPYAVVVPFTPGPEQRVCGPISAATLERRLWRDRDRPGAPTAIRIDGSLEMVRLRSVGKQVPPYPSLSEAIGHQHRRDLHDISGTMVGFCFPDGLAGIEIVGFHVHFACDRRLHGGHVLDYTLRDAIVRIDEAAELHVELPAAVDPPDRGHIVDQPTLRRLESTSCDN